MVLEEPPRDPDWSGLNVSALLRTVVHRYESTNTLQDAASPATLRRLARKASPLGVLTHAPEAAGLAAVESRLRDASTTAHARLHAERFGSPSRDGWREERDRDGALPEASSPWTTTTTTSTAAAAAAAANATAVAGTVTRRNPDRDTALWSAHVQQLRALLRHLGPDPHGQGVTLDDDSAVDAEFPSIAGSMPRAGAYERRGVDCIEGTRSSVSESIEGFRPASPHRSSAGIVRSPPPSRRGHGAGAGLDSEATESPWSRFDPSATLQTRSTAAPDLWDVPHLRHALFSLHRRIDADGTRLHVPPSWVDTSASTALALDLRGVHLAATERSFATFSPDVRAPAGAAFDSATTDSASPATGWPEASKPETIDEMLDRFGRRTQQDLVRSRVTARLRQTRAGR